MYHSSERSDQLNCVRVRPVCLITNERLPIMMRQAVRSISLTSYWLQSRFAQEQNHYAEQANGPVADFTSSLDELA